MKSNPRNDSHPKRPAESLRLQAEQKSPSLAAEFLAFILHNKKWWLIPILSMLLLLGFIAFLSGTGAAPFLYTLF
jgi:hypothetical protein